MVGNGPQPEALKHTKMGNSGVLGSTCGGEGQLSKGRSFTITGQGEEWCVPRDGGERGQVMRDGKT